MVCQNNKIGTRPEKHTIARKARRGLQPTGLKPAKIHANNIQLDFSCPT